MPLLLTALWHYLEFLAGINPAIMPSNSVFIPEKEAGSGHLIEFGQVTSGEEAKFYENSGTSSKPDHAGCIQF